MSNLYNLARSGLTAAQAGINTTGHNVANANTPGFSRQQVMVSSAGAQGGPSGYSGMGVQVDTVRRIYDGFLTNQLNQSTTAGSALSTYSGQMGRINNLLADRTVGVSPAISKFYDGVGAVASNPADPAARQEMIGRANSLVSQLSTANQFLSDQQQSINQQIDTTVQQINSFAQRISNLNAAIVDARASVSGQVPNDLLDQRDQLINGLNKLVAVTVIQDGDGVNLSVGNGQTLLSGTRVFPLNAVQSATDPARTALAYTAADGTTVELSDTSVSGGSLGGLLQFRREALDSVQNELGRIAIGLAMSFNEQHVKGLDAAGQPGQDFFSVATPVPIVNSDNMGTASASFAYDDVSRLTTNDYQIQRKGADYVVTRHPEGNVVTTVAANAGADTELSFDGVTVTMSGASEDNDSWMIQPTRNGARDIAVAISDPSAIAAADLEGGSANGRNALEMAALQTKGTLGNGTMSITGAYSQLVNGVGVKTQAIQTASTAQDSLTAQSFAAQQAVSGVNLNEEYINLDYYLQHYNASARLIDVASTMFDTLLGLRN